MKKLRLIYSLPLMLTLILLVGSKQEAHSQTLDVEFEVQKRPITLKGSVVDSESGAVLEWVSVYLLDERNETLTNASGKVSGTPTDAEGKYVIALKKTDSLIVFRKRGYEPIIYAYKGEEEVNVKLTKTAVPKKEDND